MKKYIYFILILALSFNAKSQVFTNLSTSAQLGNTNYFMDASGFEGFANSSTGKLLGFPRVNLTTFAFNTSVAEDEIVLSFFDGAVVYNNASGTTGANPATQGIATAVSPGFYYFSNPTGVDDVSVTNGQWLPLGGGAAAAVKSKTVTAINATGTEATLDLGTTIIAANEVGSFIEAKVYNADGDLVLSATSAYNKATNVLTTGNGMINEVLPAGTYSVVVAYK